MAASARAVQGQRLQSDTNEMIIVTCGFHRLGLQEIAVLLLLIASAVGAMARDDAALYEAEVAWSERDAEAREVAFRRALRQVLVKVTGLRHLADMTQTESIVENTQALVQQYQIRTVEVRSGDATVREPSLWVRFDEAAVDRIVREARFPAWSRIRPSVLVWLAAGGDGAMRMAGSDGTDRLAEILRRSAQSRGVPLVLPLFDLEDQVQAGPPDLWVEAEERIRTASERYQPGVIFDWPSRPGRLVGGTVVVAAPDAVERWEGAGDVRDLLVDEGLQEAIDILAARYASIVSRTEPSAIVASISGVHDFMAYARTMRYLESLEEVESIDVLAVVSGRLRLKLRLRTDVKGLRGLLALGSTWSKMRATWTALWPSDCFSDPKAGTGNRGHGVVAIRSRGPAVAIAPVAPHRTAFPELRDGARECRARRGGQADCCR